MGRKKAATPPPKAKQTTIRFSDSDYELFTRAAQIEGLEGNVLQWLLASGRKRARMLTSKGPVRLTEVIIPPPEGFQVDEK